MTTIITPEQYKKLGRRKSKYNSRIVTVDGIKFRSAKEARFYEELKMAVKAGFAKYFLRQIPFDLPGGTKYICDFQEFRNDGSVVYWDAKGYRTKEFIRNKKQVEALYPITITEV